MIYVYVCSKYGDHNDLATREANVKASMDAWHQLVDAGFVPYCPLLSHFLHEHKPRERLVWLTQALYWVDKCDCLLVLGEMSQGVRGEIVRARSRGIPVFYSFEELYRAYGVKA